MPIACQNATNDLHPVINILKEDGKEDIGQLTLEMYSRRVEEVS